MTPQRIAEIKARWDYAHRGTSKFMSWEEAHDAYYQDIPDLLAALEQAQERERALREAMYQVWAITLDVTVIKLERIRRMSRAALQETGK